MTDPIHKSLVVPLPPDAAFDLFTRHLQDWWPLDSHSLSAASGNLPRAVTVAPHMGGAVTETLPDGSTARWAEVTRWEPGHALGLRWHVGRPPEDFTEVTITFTAVAIGTRVDLTHAGFDRLGAAATAMAGNYQTGWDLVLGQCFARACRHNTLV